jgi:hypothetical protein
MFEKRNFKPLKERFNFYKTLKSGVENVLIV